MERDKPFYFGSKAKTFQKADALRKNMTEAEKILWQLLRRKNINGFRFRRQHPIGQFIADFYCHQAKLVLEVDGGIHLDKDQKEYDEVRSEIISHFGLKVIRFTNAEIMTEPKKVLEKIELLLKAPSQPSPTGEGAKPSL